jgi:hypothetical protein
MTEREFPNVCYLGLTPTETPTDGAPDPRREE